MIDDLTKKKNLLTNSKKRGTIRRQETAQVAPSLLIRSSTTPSLQAKQEEKYKRLDIELQETQTQSAQLIDHIRLLGAVLQNRKRAVALLRSIRHRKDTNIISRWHNCPLTMNRWFLNQAGIREQETHMPTTNHRLLTRSCLTLNLDSTRISRKRPTS